MSDDDDQAIEDAIQSAPDEEIWGGSEDDPPEEYLVEEAAKFARWHREDKHGCAECDCSPVPVVYAEEAPF